MIKVLKCEFNDYPSFYYLLSLENGDQIIISVKDYIRNVPHKSIQGNIYNAIVDEHEDAPEIAREYIGFELVQ